MFRPTIAFPFLCAAGALIFSIPAVGESVSADRTVSNLNAASPNYEIGDSATELVTLTANQRIDDVYSGKITLGSGGIGGVFKKIGDGNLNFHGEFSTHLGYVLLDEGVLTLGNGAKISSGTLDIVNASTLVIDQSNLFDGILVTVSGTTGIVENTGAGTATVGGMKGAELNVRAGKLIVSGSADFPAIHIGANAELCIGNGNANGGLVGNVAVDAEGKLSFNRVSSSDNPMTYTGTISGFGSVALDGDATVYFTAEKQTYTGETTVNAGMLFVTAEKQVQMATKQVNLNGGWFGGNAIIAGSVHVKGKYVPETLASGEAVPVGGGIYIGGAGTRLSVRGDLLFDAAQLEVVTKTDGTQDVRISDYGGRLQVSLSNAGTGLLEVAGTATLGGRLILEGADDLKPGQLKVFLRASGGIKGGFDFVNPSQNTMLVTAGVAGVRENELAIAGIENPKLRSRQSFEEHEGIGSFVDYLATYTESLRPHEVAQAVNLARPQDVTDTVNNFSALGFSALPGMGVRQSNLEVDYLRRIFSPGMASPVSADGVRVESNLQYFGTAFVENVENNDSIESPIYDFTSYGVLGGLYSWIDDERVAGATLGVHRGEAKTHGAHNGEIFDNALRVRGFVGFMPKNSNWNLILGGSVAGHYYDIDRGTAIGNNKADEFGIEAGIFVAWNYRDEIGEDLFFTPYARLDYNYVRTDTVRESGTASALNVDAFGYSSYRLRFGSGIEKRLPKLDGDILTLGCDFGVLTELGRDPSISSYFVNYGETSATTIRGRVEARSAVEIAPRMSYQFNKNWAFDAIYTLQCSSDGGISNSLTFGVRKNF